MRRYAISVFSESWRTLSAGATCEPNRLASRHSKPRGYLLGERGSVTSSEVELSVTILNVDTSEPLPSEKRRLSRDENSERSVASVREQLTPEQLAEANRIATELVKLRDAGAISAANDPEAVFFAHLLHTFGGEFIGKQPARIFCCSSLLKPC